MSFIMISFVLLHIIGILFLFGTGIYTYLKYKKSSGLFFMLSTLFFGFWGILYLLIFGIINDKEVLIYIYRIMYVFSFLGLYSMLFYVYYFNEKVDYNRKIIIFLLYLLIGIVFVFSPIIVSDLVFLEDRGYYFEVYGIAYNILALFYIIFFPIFIFISYIKVRSLNNLNKLRLKIISNGFLIFMLSILTFYLFLPYFGIYLFENMLILFLLPFLFSVIYVVKFYNFLDFQFKVGRLVNFILSMWFSILIIYFIKYFINILPFNFLDFWLLSGKIENIDLVLLIIIFSVNFNLFSKYLLFNNNINYFNNNVNKLKKYIPYILNKEELNNFLKNNFYGFFRIKYINLNLNINSNSNFELIKYFNKDISRDIFINDTLFIEGNKHKFNFKKLKKEICKKVSLVFPMFNNKNELIGLFELGNKPFDDQFTFDEIRIIKEFIDFLVGHLKYIEIYSTINDLNINLDKKVDEKTIEYNRLISKQREFISMSSHEIKTPVMSALIQVENFEDDIVYGDYDKKYLLDEVNILKEQILKISDLVKNIFSVQKHDIQEVELYLEKVKIKDIIIGEYDILHRIYPNINFKINISETIGFISIDKIQFTQVLSNLLNNAIKFVDKKSPIISVYGKIQKNNLIIIIEDNGAGFNNGDEKNIFEKYSTGNGVSVGIGMGLYLCKKIVELHGGIIKAKKSKKFGGAKFKIVIPKKD